MSLLRASTFVAAIIGLYAPSSEAASVGIVFGTQGCGQVGDSSAGSLLTFAFTCDAGGTISHVRAEGSLTTLRVAIDYDAVNNTGFPGLSSTSVGGGVTVGDFITITGGVAGSAGTLRVDWFIEGLLSAGGTGDFTIAELDYLGAPPIAGAQWAACGAYNSLCSTPGYDNPAPGGGTHVSYLIPFVFGTPLQTAFTLRGGTSGGAMNFYDTAQLQPFLVFDSLGSPVSGASATSDSGFSYAVADGPAAVPEPASLLLLGTGLALTGMRRRMPSTFWSRCGRKSCS